MNGFPNQLLEPLLLDRQCVIAAGDRLEDERAGAIAGRCPLGSAGVVLKGKGSTGNHSAGRILDHSTQSGRSDLTPCRVTIQSEKKAENKEDPDQQAAIAFAGVHSSEKSVHKLPPELVQAGALGIVSDPAIATGLKRVRYSEQNSAL
jgi:hypothetical protein